MRIISSVLGLIGSLAVALRGFLIRSEINDPNVQWAQNYDRYLEDSLGQNSGGDSLSSTIAMFEMLSITFLIVAALGALASILLLLKVGSPRALAILMLLAGLVPFINAESLIFGVPLVLAGILALFVRKSPA